MVVVVIVIDRHRLRKKIINAKRGYKLLSSGGRRHELLRICAGEYGGGVVCL